MYKSWRSFELICLVAVRYKITCFLIARGKMAMCKTLLPQKRVMFEIIYYCWLYRVRPKCEDAIIICLTFQFGKSKRSTIY